jgi:hypothetical protein
MSDNVLIVVMLGSLAALCASLAVAEPDGKPQKASKTAIRRCDATF